MPFPIRLFALALLSLLDSAVANAAACDAQGLRTVLANMAHVSPDSRSLVALGGLAEACPTLAPALAPFSRPPQGNSGVSHWEKVVSDRLGPSGDSRLRALVAAACPSLPRALAAAGKLPPGERGLSLHQSCRLDPAWASEAEVRGAYGGENLGPTAVVLGAGLYRWLVAEGANPSLARELTRMVAGLPAPLERAGAVARPPRAAGQAFYDHPPVVELSQEAVWLGVERAGELGPDGLPPATAARLKKVEPRYARNTLLLADVTVACSAVASTLGALGGGLLVLDDRQGPVERWVSLPIWRGAAYPGPLALKVSREGFELRADGKVRTFARTQLCKAKAGRCGPKTLDAALERLAADRRERLSLVCGDGATHGDLVAAIAAARRSGPDGKATLFEDIELTTAVAAGFLADRPPETAVTALKASGRGLSNEAAAVLQRQHLVHARFCYEKQQALAGALPQGEVEFEVAFQRDGSVEKVQVARSTLRSEEVESCIRNLLGRARRLEGSGGTAVFGYRFGTSKDR